MIQIKRAVLFIAVMLIFQIFASYSIAGFIVDYKYDQSSGLTEDLEDIKELTADNPEAQERIEDLEESLKFLNTVCFR